MARPHTSNCIPSVRVHVGGSILPSLPSLLPTILLIKASDPGRYWYLNTCTAGFGKKDNGEITAGWVDTFRKGNLEEGKPT